MLTKRSFLAASASLATCLVWASESHSQDYPTKPITIISAFPAGSSTDGVARAVGESLRRTLKQAVIVENKPGQDGAIGGRFGAHAQPDGYTLLLGGNSTHSAPVNLYKSIGYDPEVDFAPIGGITKIPLLLTVRPDFPADDLAGFLKIARDPQKKLTNGSGATSARVASELLMSAAKFQTLMVPYRGIANAVKDLLGGQIDMAMADPTALSLIQEGKLKAIAVTSSGQLAKLPGVKTIAEQGFPGYEVVPWLAVYAPAKTPEPIIARLRAAVATAQKDPELLKYLAQLAMEPFPLNPEELAAYLKADIQRYADFVQLAGIEKN